MKQEIITTKDGSHTLFVPELNEHYHSTWGAIGEAEHIFIRSGIAQIDKKEISIFEMGFGTGLNAFLTAIYSELNEIKVNYTTIEKYPIAKETIEKLNYGSLLFDGKYKFLFDLLHSAEWGEKVLITNKFEFHKMNTGMHEFETSKNFDVIYFDAFAPNKQPEVWTYNIFQKIVEWIFPGGRIVTYTAKGDVRRAWKKLGLKVEKFPGPPGKREFLAGIK